MPRQIRDNRWYEPKKTADGIPAEDDFFKPVQKHFHSGNYGTEQSKLEYSPVFFPGLKFVDLKVLNPKDSPNTDGLDPESVKT